jgi:hypothetical protein
MKTVYIFRRFSLLLMTVVTISFYVGTAARGGLLTLSTTGGERLRDRVTAISNADGVAGRVVISLDTSPTLSYLLARQLGVDHFNWYSEIISVPDHWRMRIIEGGTSRIIPVGETVVDPHLAGSELFIQSLLGGSEEGVEDEPDFEADALPYYYNEDDGYPAVEWLGHMHTYSFDFRDRPSLSRKFISGADDRVTFRTRLVGVKNDGSAIYWEGIGTNVIWSTNAIASDVGAQFHTLGSSATVVSGGIIDVSSDAEVPEPRGLVLVMTASVVCVGQCTRNWPR